MLEVTTLYQMRHNHSGQELFILIWSAFFEPDNTNKKPLFCARTNCSEQKANKTEIFSKLKMCFLVAEILPFVASSKVGW